MAGRIGWLETRIQQFETLPAPSETTLGSPAVNAFDKTTQIASDARRGRAWWRFS
jgi:hypothetical protein